MKILGIETSCDESAVCLLDIEGDGMASRFTVEHNLVHSQAELHQEYGGVYPNLAKREHATNMPLLLREVFTTTPRTKLDLNNVKFLKQLFVHEDGLAESMIDFFETTERPLVDRIAITHGPGLEPALWVGINIAKALTRVWDIPLVPTNHMAGHIFSGLLRFKSKPSANLEGALFTLEPDAFPLLSVLVSGGHTELVMSTSPAEHTIIGQTRDDAVGEAFDKVARLMDLGYPGGPEISSLAEYAREHLADQEPPEKLPRPMMHTDSYEFSFSGLKTAVRRLIEETQLTDDIRALIAREFEEAVTDVIVTKTLRAISEYNPAYVTLGGGVAANAYLRATLSHALGEIGITPLGIPHTALTGDNACMIAIAGYFGEASAEPQNIRADGNLELD